MRRLFVRYGVALTAAVLLAFLVPLGLLARTLAAEQAMTAARQQAQALTVLAGTSGPAGLREAVQALNNGDRQTTVFLPGGRVLGAASARTPSVELAMHGQAFTATAQGGQEILLPVAGRDGVTVIRTFVPDRELRAGVSAAWATLGLVGAVLLAAAALIGAAVARRLSRSVTVLAEVAERVGAGDLDAKVDPAGPPEVRSVGRVLNDLGARITRMLSEERELSADLSHRLRTPVTALRLDVEGLTDATERARLSAHVDALGAAVDAAVSAARSPRRRTTPPGCDAARVVRERARFWSVLAKETGRPFTFTASDAQVPVAVPSDLLGAAVDALLDNVFTHTPPGTAFSLAVATARGGRAEVAVEDAGPGIPVAALAHRGRSGAGSTGLGLDVARRAAERAGGQISVQRGRRGGARVVLSFPTTVPNLNPAMMRA